MNNTDIVLRKIDSLSKSKFRSSFRFSESDKLYIHNNGMKKIVEKRTHAIP